MLVAARIWAAIDDLPLPGSEVDALQHQERRSASAMMKVMSECAGMEGEGYLRANDQDLAGALGLLVHDLVATLHWKPEKAESLVWEWADRWLDPDHFWSGSEGPTTGGELLLRVTDSLQEWIIESVDNTWPACPVDRSHPLWLRPEMEPSAMWTCPTDGRRIARLGELTAPPTAKRREP